MKKIVLLIVAASMFVLVTAPSRAQEERLQVYYVGNEGRVLEALNLAQDFRLVSDPGQAEVLLLNGVIPDDPSFRDQVQRGTGLVLLLGPDLSVSDLEGLFGARVRLEPRDTPLSLTTSPQAADPLLTAIAWNSAPQVRDRYQVSSDEISILPLIVGYEDGSLILGKFAQANGDGDIYLFTPFLGENNPQIQNWAYFNYFIYHLTAQAGHHAPLSYAEYPGSPVPHDYERLTLLLMLLGMLVFAVVAFWFVRLYSVAHPEALDQLILHRETFIENQASTDWNEIGFHRPLGGFMLAFMFGLVLFIPLIIYQNLILPVYILPSAQALGIWGRVVQFFEFLWLFFDMGTSVAFIKFFAERRVHEPRQAILYGQVFVWWQVLSGAVQVAIMIALAGLMLPYTVYALYAWSIIVHTLIQIPGFYLVMRHALMGWQRFDYAQLLDIGWKVLFPMITQPVIVLLMIAWGRNNPIFGTAMSGLLGMGLAAYASEALTFLLGVILYRRTGYNTRVLFMAHFDWKTVRASFRFGLYEMLGSVAWAVGQATEIVVTQTRLVNYTEVWGNWMLAQNFVFAFQVISTLFSNAMPAISESISNARVVLSQYYTAMSYKWGGLVSAFIGAVLLAVADRFILGASGPEFVRAAAFAVPLIVWGAFQYPSWVGDNVQLAANKPYLKSLLIAGEQAIRIILALLLLPRFQINALIIAYFVGLFLKDIAAYFINDRLCYPQRFYFWQSLGAPLLSGVAHWAVLRLVTGWIWQGDQVTSIIIFLIGILLSYPLYAFFYGLFGGWDDATLAELERSARLSDFMQPMARLFWAASRLGARLSPLHGRFPISIRPVALLEARSLGDERVDLVQV